jgi:DivIVA domain-containing protein
MEEDDPEERIRELERGLAEPRAASGTVANQRHETTRGWLTPERVRSTAFSKPPIGKRGYNEAEVDAFLDRVESQMTSQQGAAAPVAQSGEPTRCLLYRFGGSDQQTAVLAIDVGKDAIRLVDLNGNALVASALLAEVTARPAQYGGIPVLVVDGPGLETLTIQPHPPPGQWRKRPESKKPAYLAVEAEWLVLAEKFGLASELVEEWAPQTFLEHGGRFIEEFRPRATRTWRSPLVFGLLFGVPGVLGPSLVPLAISVVLLILAALAWRFKWRI